ncbi:HTH_Tnp_Tc3_2 domain-containing protein [Trichonephila clavipes]|nr:HTH_Tnp_Tc3_2 domain-containing protein [Trichonephila clavipes]
MGVQKLDWSSQSLDLNPMEHFWEEFELLTAGTPFSCNGCLEVNSYGHLSKIGGKSLLAAFDTKDQYQSEDSVSRRPVPGRPRATTPAEDRFLALSARRRRTTTVQQLVADHFQASGRRISATTVRNRLHNAGLYARRPVVCVPLNGRQ